MRDARTNIRDALYEEPGPITKRYTAVGTVISLAALAVLAAAVVRQFYINGQLAPRYWTIFFRWTTWRFLGQGLLGTLRAAAMAGVVTFILGFILMTGRICNYRILRLIATAIIDFVRGVPTLLFIYFFFLVLPQLGIRLDAFWKVTLPVGISACGVVAEVLRSGVNAVPTGQKEAAYSLGMRETGIFLKVVFPQAIRYVIPALISELVTERQGTDFQLRRHAFCVSGGGSDLYSDQLPAQPPVGYHCKAKAAYTCGRGTEGTNCLKVQKRQEKRMDC